MKDYNKILKFFPFMPPKSETGKLVLAILFYILVPAIGGPVVGLVLGLTIILLPLAPIVGLILGLYCIVGFVFSILTYTGNEIDLNKVFKKKSEGQPEAENKAESEDKE